MVGVDGRQRQATTWAMTWAMMWATGMMGARTPAMMPAKGMVGTLAGRGRGAPGGGRGGGGGGSSGGGNGGGGSDGGGGGCMLQGSFVFYCEDIFCVSYFYVWGELARSHLSPHTLVMLEICRRTFGWGW
jgi:hypothetical protein